MRILALLLFTAAAALAQVGGGISQGSSSSVTRKVTCEIHIWGSGASSALQSADSEPKSCYNDTAGAFTITAVRCLADNGSSTTTITPIVTGGNPTSILTGALTCGNGTFAVGALNGTPTVAAGGSIDANITAPGTAKSIRIIVSGTY